MFGTIKQFKGQGHHVLCLSKAQETPARHTSDTAKQIVSVSLWLPFTQRVNLLSTNCFLHCPFHVSSFTVYNPICLSCEASAPSSPAPSFVHFVIVFPVLPLLPLMPLLCTSTAWEVYCSAVQLRPPVCEPNDAQVLPVRGFCKLGRGILFTSCLS